MVITYGISVQSVPNALLKLYMYFHTFNLFLLMQIATS